jgi:hypothetical protein
MNSGQELIKIELTGRARSCYHLRTQVRKTIYLSSQLILDIVSSHLSNICLGNLISPNLRIADLDLPLVQ